MASRHSEIKPFWQRIHLFYLYALHPAPLALSAIMAVITFIFGGFGSIGILVYVLILGITLKYSMAILQDSAEGSTEPPSLGGDALNTGFLLPLYLFGIIVVHMLLVFSLGGSPDRGLGLLMTMFGLFCYPALVIALSLSESFVYAINPLNWLMVIRKIGVPYIYMFIFYLLFERASNIMQYFLFEYVNGFIAIPAMIMTGTLFTFISFHLMGYVVYQYQDKFSGSTEHDFFAAIEGEIDEEQGPDYELLEKQVEKGYINKVSNEYSRLLVAHPDDLELKQHAYQFLSSTGQDSQLAYFAPFYIETLLKNDQRNEALKVLNDCNSRGLGIMPNRAEQYPVVIDMLLQHNRYNRIVELAKGFHNRFPNNPHTPTVYLALAKALSEGMGRDDLARQPLQYILKNYAGHNLSNEVKSFLRQLQHA